MTVAIWLQLCYLYAVARQAPPKTRRPSQSRQPDADRELQRLGTRARDHEIRRLVAERVKGLRESQPQGQKTQAWLARRIGEDKSGVIRLEQETRPITLELIERLADAFGLPPIEFLAGGSEPIWQAQDLDARLAAIRQTAIDFAEAERERLLIGFGLRYAQTLSRELAELASRLNGAKERLDLLGLSEGPIAFEREINWQKGWLRDLAKKREKEATK